MEKTKLVTMYLDKDKERILKLRSISKGVTKSRFYRDIISEYMDKQKSL